jgi:heterodisulfide reductase subunit A-like polyferredoxin
MVAAAVERVVGEIPRTQASHPVTGKVLVIGGGVAGLTASRFLASQGVPVDLVEIEETLGGNFRSTHFLLGGSDPQAFLADLIEKVRVNENIRILTRSRVKAREGSLGRFVVTIETPEETFKEVYGGVILATGAKEHEITEYGYGEHPAVLTMREFGEKLSDPSMPEPKDLVFIQCVGSREGDHPYCSRYCCSKALAHAMEVKQRWPECQVSVLFRDIMTYGNRERAYTEAREMGIHFFRYTLEDKPAVETGGEGFTVRFKDPVLKGTVKITPDYLILSNGAEADNREGIAELFALETTEDGFFKEAEVKFRPVDAPEAGIWLCGLALGPKNVNEVIIQAEAAAARALTVLRKQSFRLPHVKAWVSPRRCSACEMCVAACPYHARIKDEDLGYVVVREALCQGCGVCTTVCPNNAVKLISYQENQFFSMIDRMALG